MIEAVEDYCAEQCFYDNVIEADPTNPNVVFAAGQFDYGIGSGGIFRSDDGGQTWINLGYDQHPDFHALAFNPANPAAGADRQRRRRLDEQRPGGPPTGATRSRDGLGQPQRHGRSGDGAVTGRSNLAITQFTSIATVPQIPARFWGGTQDNGTLRKSGALEHVVRRRERRRRAGARRPHGRPVSDDCPAGFAPACVVYGTYFGISPYRMTDGGAFFFNNSYIRNGIDLDRPVRFLHAVRAEPGEPEPALPGHVPALPHRQRQDAERRQCQVEGDQR